MVEGLCQSDGDDDSAENYRKPFLEGSRLRFSELSPVRDAWVLQCGQVRKVQGRQDSQGKQATTAMTTAPPTQALRLIVRAPAGR